VFYCDPHRDDYLLFCPQREEELIKPVQDGVRRYLEDLPSEFRGGKSAVAFVSGYIGAPWRNADDYNLVFCIYSEEELSEIVNADLMIDWTTRSVALLQNPVYMSAESAFRRGDLIGAIRLFAESFLLDQKQFVYLRNIAAALRDLKRSDLADSMTKEADRLRLKLRESGVVWDSRSNWKEVPVNPSALNLAFEIERDGLPEIWGFDDLLANVRRLSEGLP
jgi:hypothetical protein